jgi:hypothetical protein
MANGGSNKNGQCQDSSVWLTRDPEKNAIGDGFKSAMNVIPIVGGLVGSLVSDTYTANAIRTCPGATVDHTTTYTQEYFLIAIIVALIFIYVIARK